MESFLYNISEKKRDRTLSIDEIITYYNNINVPDLQEYQNLSSLTPDAQMVCCILAGLLQTV